MWGVLVVGRGNIKFCFDDLFETGHMESEEIMLGGWSGPNKCFVIWNEKVSSESIEQR